uniref:Uncharacterized protein n=1 Tax=Rhizoctonia cerealis phyllomonavirus TaxID=3068671 RepID=A0AA51GGV2_9MONO|nr:MAG: hypothetical protein [Rhizoctonia cerealis phyllomonavirus]
MTHPAHLVACMYSYKALTSLAQDDIETAIKELRHVAEAEIRCKRNEFFESDLDRYKIFFTGDPELEDLTFRIPRDELLDYYKKERPLQTLGAIVSYIAFTQDDRGQFFMADIIRLRKTSHVYTRIDALVSDTPLTTIDAMANFYKTPSVAFCDLTNAIWDLRAEGLFPIEGFVYGLDVVLLESALYRWGYTVRGMFSDKLLAFAGVQETFLTWAQEDLEASD